MRLIVLLILTILPGAWITFGLPLQRFSWKARCALGAACSPAVLGIQFLALRFSGLNFNEAMIVILLGNIPALLLIVLRSPRQYRPPSFRSVSISSFAVLVVLCCFVLIPGVFRENYRAFSWHSLIHTDVIYEIARSPLLPEEPEMAGLKLCFPWIGHIYWSVACTLMNLPPTSVYWISNLLWLAIAFVLSHEMATKGLGMQNSGSMIEHSFIFLGTNILGVLIWVLFGFKWWFGDARYAPLLSKYHSFETMPFAFALLIGLTHVCVLSLRYKVRFLAALVAVLLTALGLTYPILFPAGCLLAGGLLVLLTTRWAEELPKYSRVELLRLALGFGVALILFFGYLQLLSYDRTAPLLHFEHRLLLVKSFQSLVALLPLLVVSYPLIVKSIRTRNSIVTLLVLASFLLMLPYEFLDLSRNEYKFVLASMILLSPVAAASLESNLSNLTRHKFLLAWSVFVSLTALHVLLMARFGISPPSLARAPQIVETSFHLKLARNENDANWIDAVRDITPMDTIVISRNSAIHLGPFINRSLYLPADSNGFLTAGYSLDNSYYLLKQRGYSNKVFQNRLRIVNSLYHERNQRTLAMAMRQLKTLGRPLVIHFSSTTTPSLLWLQRHKLGVPLFADTENIAWFIDRQK